MTRSKSPSSVTNRLIAVTLIVTLLPGSAALCYFSPITGVRTCTTWRWPSFPTGPRLPPAPTPRPAGPFRTAAPTQAPTPAPTFAPTVAPTSAPTPAPTSAPTPAPTSAPTPAPTTPSPTASQPPSFERECHGSLPFGLENCVCDGAVIGESAGLSACSALVNKCAGPLEAFSSDFLGSVQRACDSLAGSSCVITGRQLAMVHPICSDILAGAGSCSPQEAAAFFEDSLGFLCEPLCPDCKGDEGLGGGDSVVKPGDEEFEVDGGDYSGEADGDDDDLFDNHFGGIGKGNPSPGGVNGPEMSLCMGNEPLGPEESCACDGAMIAEASAVAACSAVFAECVPVGAFSAPAIGQQQSEPAKPTCDFIARAVCIERTPKIALQNEICARILFEGTPVCRPNKAQRIFQHSVELVCEPLCPTCGRL